MMRRRSKIVFPPIQQGQVAGLAPLQPRLVRGDGTEGLKKHIPSSKANS